jgi:hypothetical protein
MKTVSTAFQLNPLRETVRGGLQRARSRHPSIDRVDIQFSIVHEKTVIRIPGLNFSFGRLLSRLGGSTEIQSASPIPDIGPDGQTVRFGVKISTKWVPGVDQKRVFPGGSFRVAETLFLPMWHKDVVQLAASHRHC